MQESSPLLICPFLVRWSNVDDSPDVEVLALSNIPPLVGIDPLESRHLDVVAIEVRAAKGPEHHIGALPRGGARQIARVPVRDLVGRILAAEAQGYRFAARAVVSQDDDGAGRIRIAYGVDGVGEVRGGLVVLLYVAVGVQAAHLSRGAVVLIQQLGRGRAGEEGGAEDSDVLVGDVEAAVVEDDELAERLVALDCRRRFHVVLERAEDLLGVLLGHAVRLVGPKHVEDGLEVLELALEEGQVLLSVTVVQEAAVVAQQREVLGLGRDVEGLVQEVVLQVEVRHYLYFDHREDSGGERVSGLFLLDGNGITET